MIPAYNGTKNPYRKLSTLALNSPVLLNTIIALSTEYMYWHGHVPGGLAMARHNHALASLREALISVSNGPEISSIPEGEALTPKQATLAAILLQVANVVFSGGNEVDSHLVCAMHFLHELDYINQPTSSFVGRLLTQRFAMVDLATSILRRRRPHLPPTHWLLVPDESLDYTEPSFRDMTGCPQPVLGFLARISNLAADVAEQKDPGEVLDRAFGLETELRSYAHSRKTPRTPTDDGEPRDDITEKHLETLSECFCWYGHLLLQRRVYLEPTSSRRVQQTISTLIRLMSTMPVGCGPDSSLPLIFCVSAREAITKEDREWVRQRNEQMRDVYPRNTLETMLSLTEEMWTTVDSCMAARDILSAHTEAVLEKLDKDKALFVF